MPGGIGGNPGNDIDVGLVVPAADGVIIGGNPGSAMGVGLIVGAAAVGNATGAGLVVPAAGASIGGNPGNITGVGLVVPDAVGATIGGNPGKTMGVGLVVATVGSPIAIATAPATALVGGRVIAAKIGLDVGGIEVSAGDILKAWV